LTNHAHVLICISRDHTIRTRDIATLVGITERATQAIISDLVATGYLQREHEGRRNVYTVSTTAPFRHPIEAQHNVGDLLEMLERPTTITRAMKKSSSRKEHHT
jgi:DNA-binding MarR family transcriptional regulator